jgi:hypothetical protein
MFLLLAIFVMNPNHSINNNWSDKNMMNKKIMGIMALAFVMIVAASPAFAEEQKTATQTLTVNVGPTISIAVDPSVTINALADGVPVTGSTTVTSKSNKPIDVSIAASTLLLDGATTTDASALTLGDIAYAGSENTGTGSSGILSGTSTLLYTNLPKATRGALGSQSFKNTFTVTAPLGTTAGAYTTTVTYTAALHS